MNKILATPGPCPAPPQALLELSQPIEHHRTSEFKKMFAQVLSMLQVVYQTKNEVLIHCASGTGAMESLVVNLHSPGDKVLCLNAGKFGSRWADLATAYGLSPIEIKSRWGDSPRPEELYEKLDRHPDIKSVFVQACETSTGQQHPIQKYSEVLKNRNVLFLVDGITALGAYNLPMDEWGIDGLIGGSQKAFMSPTGLSFISLSNRAWAAYEKAVLPRYYFDLGPERKAQAEHQTRFSSPVSLLKSLRISLEQMTIGDLALHFEGLARRAAFCREFAGSLGLTLFPKNPAPSLTVLNLPDGLAGEDLQTHIQESYGVVFMGGQDELKGKVIRWGHMGYQSSADQIKIAEALALGLQDFDVLKTSEWHQHLTSLTKAHGLA